MHCNFDTSEPKGGNRLVEAAPSFESIGYELDSKQVRQYRINDSSTVKRAVVANIEEYLYYEGVEYDLRSENARFAVGAFSVVVGAGTYLAGLWPFRVPFPIMKPYLVMSVVVYNVCAAIMYYFIRVVDTDCFFVTSPSPSSAAASMVPAVPPKQRKDVPASSAPAVSGKANKKGKSAAPGASSSGAISTSDTTTAGLAELMAGRRVRLRAKTDAFSPSIELRAELLSTAKPWYAPAQVLSHVEQTYSYGLFFDEDGFIYPPALKQSVFALVQQLMSQKTK